MNTLDDFKVGDRVKVNNSLPDGFATVDYRGQTGTVDSISPRYVRTKIDGEAPGTLFTQPFLPTEVDKVVEDVVVSDESEFFTLAEIKEKYNLIAALYEQGFRLLKENS